MSSIGAANGGNFHAGTLARAPQDDIELLSARLDDVRIEVILDDDVTLRVESRAQIIEERSFHRLGRPPRAPLARVRRTDAFWGRRPAWCAHRRARAGATRASFDSSIQIKTRYEYIG